MDQFELIRMASRVYGKSIRQIGRETGHHRVTIRKALAGKEAQYRRQEKPRAPVMDPVAKIVEQWGVGDRQRPRQQRHTARRVYTRLLEEHEFTGAEVTVRRWVREWKAAHGWGRQEVVVPLDPEVAREAEVDWGTAGVQMAGERRQVKLFVMRSRYSAKPFVRAYPWERQEMFFDAHRHAFHYYGGVFRELVYDNLTQSVKRILRGKKRREQERFVSFRSHYTYRARYCTPGQGQEKGGVEGLIGFARRNFLVPLPRVRDFEEPNDSLAQRCEQYGTHPIGGREDSRTVEERFEAERASLRALPDRPFENFKPVRVKGDTYQTARVDHNRYSVPRAHVGCWLWAHVGCDQILLYANDRKVSQHDRVFSKSPWQIDPLHYLDLIYERVGAFESARALVQWRPQWPPDYEVLLQALRHRQGEGTGTREFVQVLQLHQEYPASEVQEAVRSVLEKGCPGYESIRQLLRAQETTPLPTGPLPAELIPGGTDRPVPCSDLSPFNAFLPAGALGVGSATPSCWRTRSSACVYRRCCEITRNVRARPEKRVKAMKAFFWIW